MWTVSPSLAVIVGTVISMILLWWRIWAIKTDKPETSIHKTIRVLLRGGILTAYTVVGLFLFDSVLRIMFSNLLSYGNFKYALASVILCTFFGIYLIFASVFVSPTWKTLVTFACMVGTMIYMEILTLTTDDIGYSDFIDNLLIVGLGVGILLSILDMIRNYIQKGSSERDSNNKDRAFTKPLWDLSNKFKKYANTKIFGIIFCFFIIELILLLEGMSFFVWLP